MQDLCVVAGGMGQESINQRGHEPPGVLATSPLVSIIVPVYNGERYLRQSLDSILGQSYSNLEVLVMDDCSVDGTPAIAASYGHRIRYFRQVQNRGIYGNANDGIAQAKGKYIAVYHADDIYGRTMVEREVAFLEQHPEAGAVFVTSIFMHPNGHEFGRLQLPRELRGGGLFDYSLVFNCLLKYKNRFLTCPSAMVPASVYRDLGVYRDRQFLNTSDLDMWLRIARKYPIGILNEHLYRYRYGHGNSAQRYRFLRTDAERFFTIMDLYLDEGDRALADGENLRGYEAHRSQDTLMRVVNHYIQGQREQASALLHKVRAVQILGGREMQRWRMLALFLLLRVAVCLPRIRFIAGLFYRRWHAKAGEAGKNWVPPRATPSGIASS